MASALDLQQNATNQAYGLNQDWYNQARQMTQPYVNAGTSVLGQLQDQALNQQENPYFNQLANFSFDYGSMQNDPLYQFAQKAALEQNARRASAMGNLNSSVRGDWDANTAANTALQYGTQGRDFAYGRLVDLNNMFNANNDNRFNRLGTLANMGQNAAVNMANIGSNYANAQGNLLTNMANASASNLLAGDAASQQAAADRRNALLGFAGAVAPSIIGSIWS